MLQKYTEQAALEGELETAFNLDYSSILQSELTASISSIQLNTQLMANFALSAGLSQSAIDGRVRKISKQANHTERVIEDLLMLLKTQNDFPSSEKQALELMSIEDHLGIRFDEYSACRKYRIEEYLKGVYVHSHVNATIMAFQKLIDAIEYFSIGDRPVLCVKLDGKQVIVNISIELGLRQSNFSGEKEKALSHKENINNSAFNLRMLLVNKLFSLAGCEFNMNQKANTQLFEVYLPLAQSTQRQTDAA